MGVFIIILFYIIFSTSYICSSENASEAQKYFKETVDIDDVRATHYEEFFEDTMGIGLFEISLFGKNSTHIELSTEYKDRKRTNNCTINFIIIIEKQNKRFYGYNFNEEYKKKLKELIINAYLPKLQKCITSYKIEGNRIIFTFSREKLIEEFNYENKYAMFVHGKGINESKYVDIYRYFIDSDYYGHIDVYLENKHWCPALRYKFNVDESKKRKEEFRQKIGGINNFCIFLNHKIDNNYDVINYDELNLKNLVSKDELNNFIKKYFLEIYDGKSNLKIDKIKFNFSIGENFMIKGNHEIKLKTDIKCENDNEFTIPIKYYKEKDKYGEKRIVNTHISLNKKKLNPQSLVTIMKDVYGYNFTDDINKYNFLLYSDEYALELIFSLKPFNEDLIFYRLLHGKKLNTDYILYYKGIKNFNKTHGIIYGINEEDKINKKSSKKKENFFKITDIEVGEILIASITNWFEINENEEVKLRVKDFKSLLTAFSDEKNIDKSEDVLNEMKVLIKNIVDARKTLLDIGHSSDLTTKKKTNIDEKTLKSYFKKLINVVKNKKTEDINIEGYEFDKELHEEYNDCNEEESNDSKKNKTKDEGQITKNKFFKGNTKNTSCCTNCCNSCKLR